MAQADLEVTFIDGASWVWHTGLLTCWIDFEYGDVMVPTATQSGLTTEGQPTPYFSPIQYVFDRAGVAKWICGTSFFVGKSDMTFNNTANWYGAWQPAKFGSWCGFVNGGNSGLWYYDTYSPYLYVDTLNGEIKNPIGLFSNQPFTFDMFIYINAYNTGTNTYYICGTDDPSGVRGMEMYISQAGYLGCQFYSVGQVMYSTLGTTLVPLNQWNHVAMCRVGDTIYLYLNGIVQGSIALPAGTVHNDGGGTTGNGSAAWAPTSQIQLGSSVNGRTNYNMTGYIDDIVITTGMSLYTGSNFTPRTTPFNPIVEGSFGQLMPPPVQGIIPPMSITGSISAFANQTQTTSVLQVVGGNGTYSNLEVISGALPAGVTATLSNNTITVSGFCTATAGTTYAFELQVQDALGNLATFSDSGTVLIAPPVWNASTTNGNGLLSNPTTFYINTGSNWTGIRSSTSQNIATANHYFELIFTGTSAGFAFIGIGNASANSIYPGNDTNSYGFDTSGNIYYNASIIHSGYGVGFNAGTLGCLIKNGALYFRNSSGWMNSADPIVAQTGYAASGLTGNWFASTALYYNATTSQLVTTLAGFTLWNPTTQGSNSWAGY